MAKVHIKWLSPQLFPGGVYHRDDGTPDPEDMEDEEEAGEVRTFFYRNGEAIEEGTYTQRGYRDVLKDLGF
jgi:hypothetical protein